MSILRVSCFIKVDDNKMKKNEVTQNSSFRYYDSEQVAEIWPGMAKLN